MSVSTRFTPFSRILHWSMAALVLAQLLIGVSMVTSLADYHWLVSLHKPIGISILVLVVIRLINRLKNPPPALPPQMPKLLKALAKASHYVFYALLFSLPIIGWAMLSAGNYPIVLYGPLHLPPILPTDPILFAELRNAHSVLAFALFATFIAHLGAALMHRFIFRDGVFQTMASETKPTGENR